jgi:hypothetical protein
LLLAISLVSPWPLREDGILGINIEELRIGR